MHDVKFTERKLLASRQTDYVTQEMQHLCRSGNCDDGTEEALPRSDACRCECEKMRLHFDAAIEEMVRTNH